MIGQALAWIRRLARREGEAEPIKAAGRPNIPSCPAPTLQPAADHADHQSRVARPLPTIADGQPTITAPPAPGAGHAGHRKGAATGAPIIAPTMPPTPTATADPGTRLRLVAADQAAARLLHWMAKAETRHEWAVDDLWFLAAEDFAPALGVVLPPRRVFLGALQRQPGVRVTYDRRVYDRQGRVKGKTTFYRLPDMPTPSAHDAVCQSNSRTQHTA